MTIEKTIAETCLLAHILVSKYSDHLPFYQQLQIFKRDFGWELAKSTIVAISRGMKAETEDDFEERKQLRLEKIREWITEQQFNVLPKSLIGKAMAYFINQYPKLQTILQDGRIESDNNLIENAIQPLALGRKNYLFAGSHRAAQNVKHRPQGLALNYTGEDPGSQHSKA